ncbi:hypothetical protein C5167_029238 [Papaver somniferum]|nr:hypothetical protein C5167_029238 [Papaver somniferum]
MKGEREIRDNQCKGGGAWGKKSVTGDLWTRDCGFQRSDEGTDWTGNLIIRCEESGLLAGLCFKGKSFLGFGGHNRSIKERIIDTWTSKTIYEADGHWCSVISVVGIHATPVEMALKPLMAQLKSWKGSRNFNPSVL